MNSNKEKYLFLAFLVMTLLAIFFVWIFVKIIFL